jgi:hypothetical protein
VFRRICGLKATNIPNEGVKTESSMIRLIFIICLVCGLFLWSFAGNKAPKSSNKSQKCFHDEIELVNLTSVKNYGSLD